MAVKVGAGIDIWALWPGEIAIWTNERGFWKELMKLPDFKFMSQYSGGAWQAVFPSERRRSIECRWRQWVKKRENSR